LNNMIEQTEYSSIELSVDLGEDIVGDCDDPPFVLNAENDGAEYLWQDGSMLSTFEVNAPGTYFVDVVFGNCVESDTLIYEIDGELNFSFGDDLAICQGENIILDASEIDGEYLWQDGSVESNFVVTQPGIYSVQITNECGTAFDEIEVTSNGNFEVFEKIELPNAFTPNSDGVNDVFAPVIPLEIEDDFSNVEFQVFNRWGNKVFSTNTIGDGWDGKIENSNATTDVYVWFFKASAITCEGESFEIFQKGDVTLIR